MTKTEHTDFKKEVLKQHKKIARSFWCKNVVFDHGDVQLHFYIRCKAFYTGFIYPIIWSFQRLTRKKVFYHVEENGDCGLPEVRFRNEGHLEEVSDHIRNERDFVLAKVEPHLVHLQTHLLTHVLVLKKNSGIKVILFSSLSFKNMSSLTL